MAALRSGVGTVIIPRENEKDLEEIDQTVRMKLHFVAVDAVEEVFSAALVTDQCRKTEAPKETPMLPVQPVQRSELRV